MTSRNYFDILPIDVFRHNIISYLATPDRINLNNLSKVSKAFRKVLFSIETSRYWNISQEGFNMCIDDRCPTNCLWKKSNINSSVFKALSQCPMTKISMHCFVDDIPKCLRILSEVGIIEKICFTLSNKSDSPTLDHLLSNMIYHPNGFNQLKELVIHSQFLEVVATAGRSKLLDIVGQSLQRLSFCNLSSSNIFSIIQAKCPLLEYLRVDKIKESYGLANYKNSNLKELELRRCDYVVAQPITELPALERLTFSFSFRLDSSQIISIVRYIVPSYLKELTIGFPSSLVDPLLRAIGKRLHQLECLTLEGAYEEGYISTSALESLGSQCKHLKYLNIDFASSKDPLVFEDSLDAFIAIVNHFHRLEEFRCHYSLQYVVGIQMLLTSTNMKNLKKITLWEQSKWMKTEELQTMRDTVENWGQIYPYISFIFEDISSCKKNKPRSFTSRNRSTYIS